MTSINVEAGVPKEARGGASEEIESKDTHAVVAAHQLMDPRRLTLAPEQSTLLGLGLSLGG